MSWRTKSFEDAATAALMNERFVNIKIDREERPDIDHLYMSALHAMGEQGGWPLTMFVAPDGAPFWGGTYFPPEPRWGRPSFQQVLQGVSEAWRTDDEMVAKNTAALRQALTRMSTATPGDLPTPVHLDAVATALLRMNDPEHGGLQGAPKFPNPPIFRFLWQNAFRTGRSEGHDALHLMLQRMSQGGIYDHLGGGYARYSTDAVWLVPHFEKMLYDNAQLLELLALAHAHRPDPLYAERAAETVGWMIRDMTAAEREWPRRVRRIGRRGQRRRGRPLLRLDRSGGGPPARQRVGCLQARLRCDARRQLGGSHDPAPCHPARFGGGRDRIGSLARRSCSTRARIVCVPDATTRCWPTGTDWRSRLWRAPRACSRGRTGSPAPRRHTTSCWRRCRRRTVACSTRGGWGA